VVAYPAIRGIAENDFGCDIEIKLTARSSSPCFFAQAAVRDRLMAAASDDDQANPLIAVARGIMINSAPHSRLSDQTDETLHGLKVEGGAAALPSATLQVGAGSRVATITLNWFAVRGLYQHMLDLLEAQPRRALRTGTKNGPSGKGKRSQRMFTKLGAGRTTAGD
jgi:hypothetical protein